MKLNKYFMLGLAGLAFAACSNDDEAVSVGADDGNKTLIVSIKGLEGASTRADMNTGGNIWAGDSGDDGGAAAAKEHINSLTFFFTDAKGEIKYRHQMSKSLAGDATDTDKNTNTKQWNALFDGNGAKFVGLKDVTAVHIIANVVSTSTTGVNALAEISNISSLQTELKKQQPSIERGAVVYVGSDKDMPVSPEPAPGIEEGEEIKVENAGDKGTLYYVAEVALKPIISRIQIKSIKVATTGKILFPTEDIKDGDGSVTTTKDKYALPWKNFKPTLHGIYLNNFAASFNDLLGTTSNFLKTQSYVDRITGGDWKIDGSNSNKDEAAYIAYSESEYGTLLEYPDLIPEDGKAELIPDAESGGTKKCIAFNILVPFDTDAAYDATAGVTGNEIANPTIHFQFAGTVDNYTIEDAALATGGKLEDGDKAFIEGYKETIAGLKTDYLLPVTSGGYLFANVNKLYKSVTDTPVELKLQPGKIYNMDVLITPVNMSVDLFTPESYNVVVKVSVVPFTEMNIYPGLE